MIKPLFLCAAATLLALAIGPLAAEPQATPAKSDNAGNWNATIARTAHGHAIGNPAAETKLIEFISYTCPHCSDFAARGEPAIELVLLQPGKVTLEVRPVIRNGLDLTLSLLAQCGDPAGFKARHQALMLSQADWPSKATNAPRSQQAIWLRADKAGRMNAASALGLTALLAERGQSQAELDACVSNDAAAYAIVANDTADRKAFGVTGTPSFALDGKLLANVYSWESLYPVLSAKFAENPDANPAKPG